MKITELNGQKVKIARKTKHQGCTAYMFEFESGMKIMLKATSSADVEIMQLASIKTKMEKADAS